jgi:hypothetical protein
MSEQKSAVPSLLQTLQNSKQDHVRWEAAKTLDSIGDIRSIPVLARSPEDSNPDVAWLAAEALKKFKKAAWPVLLHALIMSKPESVLLRQGTHHVLRNQKEDGFNDLLATLMRSLEYSSVPISKPLTAYDLLKRLKEKS